MYAALALLALALPALGLADFENTAIVRSIDLGGSSVKSTTTFAVRALRNGVNEYAISLPVQEADRTRWMEAKLKGSKSKLPLDAELPVIHDGYVVTVARQCNQSNGVF
jgi:oligosaccharyltransferase complex subunit alpha (ribophorin I)